MLLAPSTNLEYFLSSRSDGESGLPALHITPTAIAIPGLILNLMLNATTQYACIRGVNTLAAQTSAIGVTIVLNLRKLISLLFSTWWFGTNLPPGVIIGAAIVFSSAGIWAWEAQRIRERNKQGKDE